MNNFLKICLNIAMIWMSVFPPYSLVEILPRSVIVVRSEVFERWLELDEVMRVESLCMGLVLL